MSKFCGKVGYGSSQEVRPGVWEDVITEMTYFGDVTQSIRKLQTTDQKLNGDLTLQNIISIMADAYAYEHYFDIRYLLWNGAYWDVTSVEINRPRLQLRIGGIYNGPKAETP